MASESKRTRTRVSRQPKPRRRPPPPGTAPGTILVDPNAPMPSIRVMAYGPDGVHEQSGVDPATLAGLVGKAPVTWINVDGLGDAGVLQAIAGEFHIHRLALEDVVNVTQRPKVEQYEKQSFIVSRMVMLREKLQSEQISMFVGKDFLLTFQEKQGDCFDPVRERIRGGRGRIRHVGPDYLAYALIDAVVDNYYPLLEQYGDRLENLEEEVIRKADEETVARIYEIKRELLALRRTIWPQREAINSILREENPFFGSEARVYMRDCYDHAVQVMDIVETYRELGSSLMDFYLTTVSNKMNEVMKVLTIIATIFIPLGFIAGVYGMNFSSEASPWNLPELNWKYGYFYCLGLMSAVSIGMLVFFRRKGWLGSRRSP